MKEQTCRENQELDLKEAKSELPIEYPNRNVNKQMAISV